MASGKHSRRNLMGAVTIIALLALGAVGCNNSSQSEPPQQRHSTSQRVLVQATTAPHHPSPELQQLLTDPQKYMMDLLGSLNNYSCFEPGNITDLSLAFLPGSPGFAWAKVQFAHCSHNWGWQYAGGVKYDPATDTVTARFWFLKGNLSDAPSGPTSTIVFQYDPETDLYLIANTWRFTK